MTEFQLGIFRCPRLRGAASEACPVPIPWGFCIFTWVVDPWEDDEDFVVRRDEDEEDEPWCPLL